MDEQYINTAIKRNNDVIEFMYNNINNIINENPDLINKENIMFISLCRYFANTYIHVPHELLYERLIEDKIIIWNYLVAKYIN